MPFIKAQSAFTFADSIGVCMHIDQGYPAAKYIEMLQTVGLWHIRTGTPLGNVLGTYKALADAGAKYCLFECNVYMENNRVNASNDVDLAVALEQQAPGSVWAMEGCNEYDFWHYMLNGADSYQNYGPWGPDDAAQLDAAMRGASVLADADRVSPSIQQIAKMPRSYGKTITMSNSHAYNPEMGGNIQHHINAGVDYARAYAPGLPVCITETGCSSGGYVNGGYSSGTERTQEIIVLNCALEGFYAGAFKTYIYELNSWSGASGAVEENFGIFETDGRAKPAAISLGNLMAIAGSRTPVDDLGGLDFEVDGLPGSASVVLLQKADGTLEIVLWNGGADISDGNSDTEVKPSNVTVTFAAPVSVVNIYDPVAGRTSRSSASNVRSIQTTLAATPVIVEIPASMTIVSTGASDTFNF